MQAVKTQQDQWHAERRQGIGGSDAAAALGLSKFRTPYQLYLEKIGETGAQDETWEMSRGKAMEPLLRQHYANETGQSVQVFKDAMVSPDYPFMRYNPDGIVKGRLVEFKTAAYGNGWGATDTDEIPQEYLLQVQHGMIVTGLEVTDVTVSIAGNKPKYFVVEADRELQEMIIDGEAKFWDLVQNRTAPDPQNNDDVAKMYSRVNGQSITATPEILIMLGRLHLVRDSIKNKEMEKEQLEVEIKHFMGEAEILVNDGMVPVATWKQAKGAERVDSKSLKENEPDVWERYLKIGDPTRRFLLK